MRKITKKLLQAKGACDEQVALFTKLWPQGVVPSLEAILRAQAVGLDLRWAACVLLSPMANSTYNAAMEPARKACNEAVEPARKAYNEAVEPARKAYNEAVVAAEKDYNEAVVTAEKDYNEAVAAAEKDYNEAVAAAKKAYYKSETQALWRAMKEDACARKSV